jgi:hypothetical protein
MKDALWNDFKFTHRVLHRRPLRARPARSVQRAPEFAGDALVVMQTRRLVEYDRVRQQPLNGHRLTKHGAKLAEMLSQSLGTSAIRYADSDNIVVLFSLSINLQARFWRTLSARTLGAMRVILAAFIRLLTFRFRKRMSLELELVALRHQLGVLQRTKRHPPLIRPVDRLIWGWLYRLHPKSLRWLRIAKPETVIKWHRRGFLYYWRYKCRRRGSLPRVVKGELRRLIFQMYHENPTWGAGRIHGELQKLGYKITKQTVHNWLKRLPPRPPPGWRTFLDNHMRDAAAMDMFVVVTMSFRLLFAMVIINLDRRKILHVSATEHPTQNWLANEVTDAFSRHPRPNYLIRDRDRSYGIASSHSASKSWASRNT